MFVFCVSLGMLGRYMLIEIFLFLSILANVAYITAKYANAKYSMKYSNSMGLGVPLYMYPEKLLPPPTSQPASPGLLVLVCG